MRCDACYHTSGLGHVYQQRYMSFPIQELDTVRLPAHRGRPLGVEAEGRDSIASRLNLESTMRPQGRARVHFSEDESSKLA